MGFKSLATMIDHTLSQYKMRAYIHRHFKDVLIEPNVVIKGVFRNMHLGEKVNIQSGTVLHLGGMAWCKEAGYFEVGEHGVIGPNAVIFAAGMGGVRIGQNFDCGPGVGIFAARTDYEKGVGHHIFRPVIIGDNVTIYTNAVISPGVTIGNGAVIAACSTVTEDVPDNAFVGGSPARIIRMLHSRTPLPIMRSRFPLIDSPRELLCLQD